MIDEAMSVCGTTRHNSGERELESLFQREPSKSEDRRLGIIGSKLGVYLRYIVFVHTVLPRIPPYPHELR